MPPVEIYKNEETPRELNEEIKIDEPYWNVVKEYIFKNPFMWVISIANLHHNLIDIAIVLEPGQGGLIGHKNRIIAIARAFFLQDPHHAVELLVNTNSLANGVLASTGKEVLIDGIPQDGN